MMERGTRRHGSRFSPRTGYPPQSNILEIEIKTAARAAKVVFESNLARVARPADYEAFIRSHVYKPEYCSEIV
jgi:malate dehydrogenase (oxaloacetate-decarboxylating)(NADP+)